MEIFKSSHFKEFECPHCNKGLDADLNNGYDGDDLSPDVLPCPHCHNLIRVEPVLTFNVTKQ